MTVTLTEQIKLHTTPAQDAMLLELAERYTAACDYVSGYVFEHNPSMNANAVQAVLYDDVRALFSLKAQLTCSVFKTVAAKYQTVREQYKDSSYKVRSDNKTLLFKRDLNWLQSPISFHAPQADLVKGRDWSFRKNKVSVATLTGRIVIPYDVSRASRLHDPAWTQGTAKLVFHKTDKHWYLHISVTGEVPDVDRVDVKQVVGIDRGLVNIVTVRDADHTEYVSGKDIVAKRAQYDRVRASLQANGTRGAKRVLKRVSGRENGWMSDVNHQISKALVREYPAGTLFVLENLAGVSFSEENLNRGSSGRHNLRNWAFYDLEKKLCYKAALAGDLVIKVDPHYTSQACPCCGTVRKESRDLSSRTYHCPVCGGTWNDDEVSAINLRHLGIRYLLGEQHPKIKKPSGAM